jgi:hypothetical protein
MFLQAPIAMTSKGEGGTFIPSVIGLKKNPCKSQRGISRLLHAGNSL